MSATLQVYLYFCAGSWMLSSTSGYCVPRSPLCLGKHGLTLGLRALQGKYDVIKMTECNNFRAHKEKKREDELAGLQRDFTVKKEQLRNLVDQHNLRDADPLGMPSCLSCRKTRAGQG